MTISNSVSGEKIRAYIERVERVQCGIDELNADKSDIFKEAKSLGFCVNTLKQIIKIRKKSEDERQEEEAILDLYLSALGMKEAPFGDYTVDIKMATAS